MMACSDVGVEPELEVKMIRSQDSESPSELTDNASKYFIKTSKLFGLNPFKTLKFNSPF